MAWCPKCRTEYRNGFTTCNDCNSELVDRLDNPEKVADTQYDKEAFLISVGGSIEADMMEALLNESNIPVLKKFRDAGDYLKIYMGGTIYGVDIYVPSRLLGEAKQIVFDNYTDEQTHGDEEQYDNGSLKNARDEHKAIAELSFNRKRRIRTWIILLLFVPGIAWIIFWLIYSLFQWLSSR